MIDLRLSDKVTDEKKKKSAGWQGCGWGLKLAVMITTPVTVTN